MFFNDLIFVFILIAYSYLQNRILLNVFNKNRNVSLSDSDFTKPQAFHEKSTYRIGGITIFLALIIIFLYSFFFNKLVYFEYISFCTIFFILGLIDDLKINLKPKLRLLLMSSFLIVLIINNNFYIEKTGLGFLNNLLEIDIFSLFFVCLCFLFIINGSNLIDGFNGLLGIHSLIIFIVLFTINLIGENSYLAEIIFFVIMIILVFLKFNFPNAKIFLGDSGAYLIGVLIAISIINTSIANPDISPFFFCILLFYLFFEVFFSFIRKLFFARQSPFFPDGNHLHMLVYKFVLKKNKRKLTSNYMTSLYINLFYVVLIIPGTLFMNNGMFCKYYFLFLLLSYIYFYKMLYRKIKS